MATTDHIGAPRRADHTPTPLSPADAAAHDLASYVRPAPLPTDLPVAPLPVSVIAAMHRIEARLAAVPNGESLTINGVTCTAVSLRVADLLARHDRLQSRCRRLSVKAVTSEDYNQLFDWHVFLTDCRCQLEAAGALHLAGGAL